MVMEKIETGVRVPRRGLYGVLDDLQIGESTLLPLTVNRVSLRSCISYRQVRYNKHFTVRTLPEGIRVWRTA
jgi:hypothetical protein